MARCRAQATHANTDGGRINALRSVLWPDMTAEDPRLVAAEVARREFAHGFRGYQVDEVRAFLREVAAELDRADAAVHQLSEDLAAAREERPVSREELTERLGGEAARVLSAAEDSAAEIRARAEQAVEKMLRQARSDAAQVRSEAERDAAAMLESAEERRDEQERELVEERARAEHDAERVRAEALDVARDMVAEAKTARRQMLVDLADRRQRSRRELAQLRAGIEQLQESYDELRSMLDGSQRVADTAVDAARQAAVDAADHFDRTDDEDDLAVASAAMARPNDVDESPASFDAPAPPPVWTPPPVETAVEPEPEPEVVDLADDAPVASDDTSAPEPELDAEDVVAPEAVAEVAPQEAAADDDTVDDDLIETAAEPGPVEDHSAADESSAAESVVLDPDPVLDGESIDAATEVEDEPAGVDEPAEVEQDEQVDLPDPVDEADAADDAEAGHDSEDAVDSATEPEPDATAEPDTAAEPETPEAVESAADDEIALDESDDEHSADDDAADDPTTSSEGELPDVLDDGEVPEPSASRADAPLLGPNDRNIDELFARIRSSRSEAVTAAQQVLSEQDAAGASAVEAPPRRPFAELPDAPERIATVSSAMKRALNDQLNEVLDALRQAKLPTSTAELLGDAAAGSVGAASTEALASTVDGAEVGSAVSVIDEELGSRLVAGLDEILSEDGDAAVRVRGLFRELRREHVESVARAAAAAAHDAA